MELKYVPEVELVNLTPHPVKLITDGGKIVVLPSGKVARVKESVSDSASIRILGKEVELVYIRTGEVENLPEPEAGKLYIVSRPIAMALAGKRKDVVVPDDFIRDEKGNIIGARRLAILMA